MAPIFEELKEQGANYPKTIVYVPLAWCGELHYLAEKKYGVPPGLIGQYTAPQTKKVNRYLKVLRPKGMNQACMYFGCHLVC